MMSLYCLLTLLISGFIAYLSIPRIVFVSTKKKLFDTPNERSSHTRAIPRLGGVTFFPGLLFSFAFILGLRELFGAGVAFEYRENVLHESLFMICGLILMYGMGILDDLRGVGFKKKFFGQIICATLMMMGGVYLDNLQGIFGIYQLPMPVAWVLTAFLTVLIINAINLIDGIDGLASGLSSVALTVYAFWYLSVGLYTYSMFAFGLLGSVLVFFFFNVFGKRMKLFMGDTGSLIIGFCMAFLSIKFCQINESGTYGLIGAPVLAFSIIFIPIFDVFRVFIVRMRHGKSPFRPDKNHIHHKLLSVGLSHRQAMVLLLISAFGFIVFNWFMMRYIGVTMMFVLDILIGLLLIYSLQRVIWTIYKSKKLSTGKTK